MTTLGVIQGATVVQHEDGKVSFQADADIDADGANGQNGAPCAYMEGNRGTEHLKNAGYPDTKFYKDILVCSANGQPVINSGGRIFSRTAYEWKGRDEEHRYVDSETVPYIVVPPSIRRAAKGVVLGCRARITYMGRAEENAVVADIGPAKKVGEISIAAARAVGMPSNPRTGGESRFIVKYEFWPDVPAVIAGETYNLIRA